MSPLTVLCVVACFLASAIANPTQEVVSLNGASDSLRPTQRLTSTDLTDSSLLNDITLEKLERMPVEEGAKIMQKWYHNSQMNSELMPSFVPSPSNIPVYVIKNHDKKETGNLNNFVKIAKQDPNFGDAEVTIFITGLPSTIETVRKANQNLIQSYMERYNYKQENTESYKNDQKGSSRLISGEGTFSEWHKAPSGNLIVIDLGQTINNFESLASLNVDETGAIIGKALVHLTNDCDVPQEVIHVIGQGVAAHVAGAAGDEYARLVGDKLRRITALDPSKILAKKPHVLTGLARGDAEFVDAIHTSVYGMGTLTRLGDIDFFPSGLCAGAPGTENVIEASMRATHYFAESVRPGNERNFPAVEANSLKQYKKDNGFGKRSFMGIGTDYDLKGDYMLLVNEKSPYGMRALAEKPNTYHGIHEV